MTPRSTHSDLQSINQRYDFRLCCQTTGAASLSAALWWIIYTIAIGCSPSMQPAQNSPLLATTPGEKPQQLTDSGTRHNKSSDKLQSAIGATECGALGCLQFKSDREAFLYVLSEVQKHQKDNGWVLGIGEAHAQKDELTVRSSAKRFTEELLPLIEPIASDLVLELMLPPRGCQQVQAQVENHHAPVRQQQAQTSQHDYIALGNRARSVGIVPDLLRPSCDDLKQIELAGDDAISKTLEVIARLTQRHVDKLLQPQTRTPEQRNKLIVLYGGALHNDPSPSPQRVKWSYGPWMLDRIGSGYIALDLFVPESIKDTDIWRKQPWRPYYHRDTMADKATVYHLEDGSMVLILSKDNASSSLDNDN